MPEGPEVETVRRTLAPLLEGQTITDAWVSRFSLRTKTTRKAFAPLLGQRVVAVERHGKLLWFRTAADSGAMIRLGMTGQVSVVEPRVPRAKHTHVRLSLDGGRELRYVDARRFGDVLPFPNLAALTAERERLGPDPLTFTPEDVDLVTTTLGKTQRRIKDALLDQAVVAGVGNIYVCEALFYAGVDPRRRANSVSQSRRRKAVEAVREVLLDGVRNGGTTLRDYLDADGNRGDHQNHLAVFQREGEACPQCGGSIAREVWGGRSTFFCRRCQR